MIEFLKGTLIDKNPAHLVLDVNGVGYGINVSLKTSSVIGDAGSPVEIETFLNVKEDALELYGFNSGLEKQVFLKLITVSGVGPKIALRILSEVTPEKLISYILDGKTLELVKLKGIGKKTAEVMIASLKVPLSKLKISASTFQTDSAQPGQLLDDAVRALVTLGVKDNTAQNAVEKVLRESGSDMDISRLISLALKVL